MPTIIVTVRHTVTYRATVEVKPGDEGQHGSLLAAAKDIACRHVDGQRDRRVVALAEVNIATTAD